MVIPEIAGWLTEVMYSFSIQNTLITYVEHAYNNKIMTSVAQLKGK